MLESDKTSFYGQMALLGEAEEESKEEEFVKVDHKSTLLMLMACKDDNLLLQMGSLFNSLIASKGVSDNLKQKMPELFGEYKPPTQQEISA